MKLILAIIQDKFVNDVVLAFLNSNIKITKLSSTGGFLKSGNTTFLIGVDVENLEIAKELIKKSVKSEVIEDNNSEIMVHGAHLFIMDINKALSI